MSELLIDPLDPPDLRGSLFLEGEIDGCPVKTWSDLVRESIRLAIRHELSVEDIRRESSLNVVHGCIKERGFVPLSIDGPSIQYADANKSWVAARNIANTVGSCISIKLVWKSKVDEPSNPMTIEFVPSN